MTSRLKLPPAVIALVLQCTAFLLLLLVTANIGMKIQPLLFAILCGLLAALFSLIFCLAKWWLPIQLLFAPLLVLMLTLDLPPHLFLIAFLVLLLIYWGTFRSQVPLYLSSQKVWLAIEQLLPHSSFTFLDLGSGLGGILTHLAKVRPDGSYTGIEAAPLPYMWSWLRIRIVGHHNCSVYWGNLWNHNLSSYDVVFAYLSPVPMEQLWLKARKEMRPGTLFISSTFAIPNQSPDQTIAIDDLHRSILHIWHM